MINSYNGSENNNTDDTIIYIPRKIINKLTIENGAKEKVMNEKMNILQNALKKKNDELNKIKEKRESLNQNEEYNIANYLDSVHNNKQIRSNNVIKKYEEKNKHISEESKKSTSSIFVKKDKSSTNDKKQQLYQNGCKSEKHTTFKQTESSNNNTSSDSNTSDDSNTFNDSDSSDDDSDTSSFENESDIYRATETEDGFDKAYTKLNNEMEYISKSQKCYKMNGKEIVKRINFLLNGIKILDNVKRTNC